MQDYLYNEKLSNNRNEMNKNNYDLNKIYIQNRFAFWLFPIDSSLKAISSEEEKVCLNLSTIRARQYHYSRGYVRYALSCLFNVPPLDIPLTAMPGQPAQLCEGWGYISFSHCNDALFVGWSQSKLGVDIENQNRIFQAERLVRRFLFEEDKYYLSTLKSEKYRNEVLKLWVKKEAAIKWQRGSIASDLSEWVFRSNDDSALHKRLNINLNVCSHVYNSWYISIASQLKVNSVFPFCKA